MWDACLAPVVGGCVICSVLPDFAEFHGVATKKQMVLQYHTISEFGDDKKLLGFVMLCLVLVKPEKFRETASDYNLFASYVQPPCNV